MKARCGGPIVPPNGASGTTLELPLPHVQYKAQPHDMKLWHVDGGWLAFLLERYEANPRPSKRALFEFAWQMRVPVYAVEGW